MKNETKTGWKLTALAFIAVVLTVVSYFVFNTRSSAQVAEKTQGQNVSY